jgi:hypothetical protein
MIVVCGGFFMLKEMITARDGKYTTIGQHTVRPTQYTVYCTHSTNSTDLPVSLFAVPVPVPVPEGQ